MENEYKIWEPNDTSIKVEKLVPHATIPIKANKGDLGYDLFAAERKVLDPHRVTLVSTGLKFRLPDGWGFKIFDRGSVAVKRELITVAGVVDNGFIGEVFVALLNPTDALKVVGVGEKIAQFILMPVIESVIKEVEDISVYGTTQRGEGMLGSSNVSGH